MSKENKYQPGRYGDGSFGPHHTMKKVFEISFDEGFEDHLSKEDYALVSRFLELGRVIDDEDDIFATLTCIEDEAIDYLNEHCSDDTHYWGYETGDFGYWEIDEE
jgi:hypothetical protein